MRTATITTFDNFTEEFGQSFLADTCVYRGVPNGDYQLIPSLGRLQHYDEDLLDDYETRTLEDFKRRALAYVDKVPTNEWEWLFLAQHHGLPTRLLDWSSNPLVALYFATESLPDIDGAIYSGDFPCIYLGGKQVTGDASRITVDPALTNPFDIQGVHVVRPPHSHQRYVNQSSLFTIQDNPMQPVSDSRVVKYIIPASSKARFQQILIAFGINRLYLFPTLENLVLEIRSHWDDV